MSGLRRSFLLAGAILVAVPLAAWPDVTPEERAEGQRKLDKWRADPAFLARMRAHALAFLELPTPRQEQLVKLDRELHALPARAETRLLEVGRRYAAWLDRLPEADRQKIKDAPESKVRLERIRELREQEWIRRLPLKQRETLEKAAPAERARLSEEYLREQRQRRREWQMAFQHWDDLIKRQHLPSTLADFPPEVQTYVDEYLRHWLSPEEQTRLKRVQGNWPAFPYALVALADKHPMALPGAIGPTQFKDLPADVQTRLSARLKNPGTAALKKAEGKWPDYAIVVTNLAHNRKVRLPYELWPSRREDLSAGMVTFLDRKLLPALKDLEKVRLKDAEGKWPQYPRAIQELARQHKLQVPWQTLPGPREKWDNYRFRLVRPGNPMANPALIKAGPLTP